MSDAKLSMPQIPHTEISYETFHPYEALIFLSKQKGQISFYLQFVAKLRLHTSKFCNMHKLRKFNKHKTSNFKKTRTKNCAQLYIKFFVHNEF